MSCRSDVITYHPCSTLINISSLSRDSALVAFARIPCKEEIGDDDEDIDEDDEMQDCLHEEKGEDTQSLLN